MAKTLAKPQYRRRIKPDKRRAIEGQADEAPAFRRRETSEIRVDNRYLVAKSQSRRTWRVEGDYR